LADDDLAFDAPADRQIKGKAETNKIDTIPT
jgi:hypothetical protein